MALLSAVFPAPWWTPLCYTCANTPPDGVRVLVPPGHGRRVGVAVRGACSDIDGIKLKPVNAVLDERPPLPDELMRLAEWFGRTWFIGTGFALKTILPSRFFSEEELAPLPEISNDGGAFSCECVYTADTSKRYERFRAVAESDARALILFPEVKLAKAFFRSLSKDVRDEGILWPSAPSAQWNAWKLARSGGVRFIAGALSAAFAPLAGLSSIVMDEENSGSWRTRKHPVFHMRALVGMRASLAGARLLLGGAMPSSKGYMRSDGSCDDKENKISSRLVFVSTKESQTAEFDGIRGSLPISLPLLRETAAARRAGKWAFWLLDRKGCASEILCDECGAAVRCKRCSSAMRLETDHRRLRCVSCGETAPLPDVCPNCGGVLLSGSRPGIGSLYSRACGALSHRFGDVLLIDGEECGGRGKKDPDASALIKKYPGGALVVGTRRVLSLCDELSPAAVGWIDADAEARSEEYNADEHAFAMIWESMHRGRQSGERCVIVQSRRPARGWQEGLARGAGFFWRQELEKRREWDLPPFTPMIKIAMPKGEGQKIIPMLESLNIECQIMDESPDEVWARTKRFSAVAKILRPYFEIGAVGKTYPAVLLYLD